MYQLYLYIVFDGRGDIMFAEGRNVSRNRPAGINYSNKYNVIKKKKKNTEYYNTKHANDNCLFCFKSGIDWH